jgi:tRNA pseudouridine38-40 synthase
VAVYRLDLAYDGSGFKGYARQEGKRTVQGELESALGTYLKTTVTTAVAGRTDAGVHARHQVVSFPHDDELDLQRLQRAVNGIVPLEISVFAVSRAADDFNARHSAIWRRYRYQLDTRPYHDPLARHAVWHPGRTLDVAAMSDTARTLVGEHDFSSFCRSVEGRSNVRRVTDLWLEDSDGLISLWIQANAFCHQMVRSIVGYLFDVGRGFSDGAGVGEVLAARDRSAVATVAPPHGLTLWDVGYE